MTCGRRKCSESPLPKGADGAAIWGWRASGDTAKTTPGSLRLPPPLIRGISEFPVAKAADFGVGFDGFGAMRASAGAHRVAEGAFLEGALVVFNHLLDAL